MDCVTYWSLCVREQRSYLNICNKGLHDVVRKRKTSGEKWTEAEGKKYRNKRSKEGINKGITKWGVRREKSGRKELIFILILITTSGWSRHVEVVCIAEISERHNCLHEKCRNEEQGMISMFRSCILFNLPIESFLVKSIMFCKFSFNFLRVYVLL